MTRIKAVSVWWYLHHPAETEVNFFHQIGEFGTYDNVTPSSRRRLGDVLSDLMPRVGIGAFYTCIYYRVRE